MPRITKPITRRFASLIRSFNVGNNYLEGGIPWSYSDGLQVVDLSWNWFEGPIPTNITGRFTSFEFENNFLTGLVPQSLWAQPLLMYTNKWISADSAACPVGTSGDIDGAPFPDGSCVLCHNTTCAPYLAQVRRSEERGAKRQADNVSVGSRKLHTLVPSYKTRAPLPNHSNNSRPSF